MEDYEINNDTAETMLYKIMKRLGLDRWYIMHLFNCTVAELDCAYKKTKELEIKKAEIINLIRKGKP